MAVTTAPPTLTGVLGLAGIPASTSGTEDPVRADPQLAELAVTTVGGRTLRDLLCEVGDPERRLPQLRRIEASGQQAPTVPVQ